MVGEKVGAIRCLRLERVSVTTASRTGPVATAGHVYLAASGKHPEGGGAIASPAGALWPVRGQQSP